MTMEITKILDKSSVGNPHAAKLRRMALELIQQKTQIIIDRLSEISGAIAQRIPTASIAATISESPRLVTGGVTAKLELAQGHVRLGNGQQYLYINYEPSGFRIDVLSNGLAGKVMNDAMILNWGE